MPCCSVSCTSWAFGADGLWWLQNKLAKVVIDRVPSIEMVRFVNSGTEACLSVLRYGVLHPGHGSVLWMSTHPSPHSSMTASHQPGSSFGRHAVAAEAQTTLCIDNHCMPSHHLLSAKPLTPAVLTWQSLCRLMRAFTKREKLIKFSGCYHGHADAFLVAAGSGVATLNLPDSPGVLQASVGMLFLATVRSRSGWRAECCYTSRHPAAAQS